MLEIGKAGEHFVCFHLLMKGYNAFLADQGQNYDILLDKDGILYRIQVKSSQKAKNVNSQGRNERVAYSFSAKRMGKNGSKSLSKKDADIIAVVALDIGEVAYFPIEFVGQTLQLSPPDIRPETHTGKDGWGKNISQFPIEKAIINDKEHYLKTSQLTHCKYGHKYTEENTARAANGSRYCRECSRKNGREYARKKRADKTN